MAYLTDTINTKLGSLTDATSVAQKGAIAAVGGQTPAAGFSAKQQQQVGQIEVAASDAIAQQVAGAAQQLTAKQATEDQLILDKQQQQSTVAIQQQRMSLGQRAADLESQFFRLSQGKAREIQDATLKFNRNEMGRIQWNERQLADWAIMNAKSDEDLANYKSSVQIASARRTAILQASHEKIVQFLKFQSQATEQVADQGMQRRLALAKQAIEAKMAAQKRKDEESAAQSAAIGGILGAAIQIGIAVFGG